MAKKLILADGIEEYLCGDKFYVGKDMILSSGAKDFCKEKNIVLVYGEKPETETSEVKKPEVTKSECKKEENCAETLKAMVTRILKDEFNIENEKLADAIVKKCEGVRD